MVVICSPWRTYSIVHLLQRPPVFNRALEDLDSAHRDQIDDDLPLGADAKVLR